MKGRYTHCKFRQMNKSIRFMFLIKKNVIIFSCKFFSTTFKTIVGQKNYIVEADCVPFVTYHRIQAIN